MTLWRKVKVDRDAWPARSLADADIVRPILEGHRHANAHRQARDERLGAGGHAPQHLHEEFGADFRDMIHADRVAEAARRRRA